MTVSVAVRPSLTPRVDASLPRLYVIALLGWLLTRLLVLVHQGAWPWMNAFVVAAARGIIVGDWNDAVRPQLPAVLGVPLVLAGLTEQQAVAVLYVFASAVQFCAFLVLVRALFPGRLEAQALAVLLFLLVPFNHSIHHYRDVPVVLASSAVFLLGATFVNAARSRESQAMAIEVSRRQAAMVVAAALLGVWSRAEVLTFMAVLILLAVAVWRTRAVKLALTYALAAVIVSGSLLLVYRLEGVDLSEASVYQAHTFLDSTPDSWLSADCRANATENCREADGLIYFGPADLRAGLVPLILNHPLATAAKTARSGWDNLWILLGPNLSTFPASVPFLALAVALARPARDVLARVHPSIWLFSLAVLGETVLPPLSWAPPHPQYHLQLVAPLVAVAVPILLGLARLPRGRVFVLAFLIGNAGLSAVRYTRYAGY